MLLIVIVVFLLGFGVARYTTSRFDAAMMRGRRMTAPENKTGADIAAEFLAAHEASDVQIVRYNAVVSDYFDAGRRRLFLRSDVHDGTDLAAWSLALHEAAHALQTGEDRDALKWRRTCISMTRYLPTAAGFVALALLVFRRVPGRYALLVFLAVCAVALLLNIGTLAIEYNANRRVLRWLEDRLHRHPEAIDKMADILSSIATREVGDVMNSPRYFFLSALPGTSKSRPTKNSDKGKA